MLVAQVAIKPHNLMLQASERDVCKLKHAADMSSNRVASRREAIALSYFRCQQVHRHLQIKK